ncbi:MAG TPA: NEL-type E3 ubiquitin ligase domain-containing protein [Burkholderiaceae bacterium]|nr:NEL-type E3 ubiquitin ligase domain-containing protein [Burkholderiaceae bacterium]
MDAAAQVARHDDLSTRMHHLRNDPLETMLHAKVQLRLALGLPEEVPSQMDWRSSSELTDNDLNDTQKRVQAREADGSSLREWLLGNDTWRAGMKQLHREAFHALDREFDDDPFFDLDLPPQDGDEHVAARIAYTEAAKDLELRKAQAENQLLLKCAELN